MKAQLHSSDVVTEILDDMPSDPTDLEDAIQSSLLLGKPIQALSYAAQFDVWLAAHMADLMQALGLLENETTEWVLFPNHDPYILLTFLQFRSTAPRLLRASIRRIYATGSLMLATYRFLPLYMWYSRTRDG